MILFFRKATWLILNGEIIAVFTVNGASIEPVDVMSQYALRWNGSQSIEFVYIEVRWVRIGVNVCPVVSLMIVIHTSVRALMIFYLSGYFQVMVIRARIYFRFFYASARQREISLIVYTAFRSWVRGINVYVTIQVFDS